MSQIISKISIKNSSGTGYDTRDIGAKGQNVKVGYNASDKIILDVDTETPTTTKQLTEVLQNAESNISNLNKNKAPDNHAWSDADAGVNHGLADGTHYGHIKVGNGLTNNGGTVSVAYGTASNTACQGNDSRLSNARKNPNAVTFSDGTTNTTYDGSSAKTVTAATVGAAPAGHTTVNATSSILGHVKTGTGITNSSGTISVSYGTVAGTACQGNDNRLSDSRTPKSHADSTASKYGKGTTSLYGHLKISDDYNTEPSTSYNASAGVSASLMTVQILNKRLKWIESGYDGAGCHRLVGVIQCNDFSVSNMYASSTITINKIDPNIPFIYTQGSGFAPAYFEATAATNFNYRIFRYGPINLLPNVAYTTVPPVERTQAPTDIFSSNYGYNSSRSEDFDMAILNAKRLGSWNTNTSYYYFCQIYNTSASTTSSGIWVFLYQY